MKKDEIWISKKSINMPIQLSDKSGTVINTKINIGEKIKISNINNVKINNEDIYLISFIFNNTGGFSCVDRNSFLIIFKKFYEE